MDRHSILDPSSASSAVEEDMPGTSASRSATASVSAGIAAANAHVPKSADPGPRFPGEDGGRSLGEIAQNDLDAALQLLAERAQYITGASGAAIALRRGQHNDMLCRASVGSNAPELGSLLSMEYGLSGECVRTRQPLRCDDAERDPRVNREVCSQLGIASVVVMPIVSEERVFGVFELFSGKARAFEERDVSALQRLSEMVETAVKHAVASQTMPAVQESTVAELQPPVEVEAAETAGVESSVNLNGLDTAPAPPESVHPPAVLAMAELEQPKPAPAPPPAPKKPLFWSAALQPSGSAGRPDGAAESIAVPPVLRNLQKCQACGFPVSQGRTYCVECEEKQWRGQRSAQPAPGDGQQANQHPQAGPQGVRTIPGVAVAETRQTLTSGSIKSAASVAPAPASIASASDIPEVAADMPGSGNPTLFLSSSQQPDSWFAANKYILGALLLVAIVIGAIAWLR